MATLLNRQWYSQNKVRDIIQPNLSSWNSRYDLKEELLLNDDTLVIRNMRAADMIPGKSSNDIFHIIEPGEKYRPDVIATNAYGDPRLAWVILSANGLSDIFDFVTGLEIIIPAVALLYTAGGVLTR